MDRSLIAALHNALRSVRYSYLFLPILIAIGFGCGAFALVSLDRSAGAAGVGALFPAGARPLAQSWRRSRGRSQPSSALPSQ